MANITNGRCYHALPESSDSPPLFQNGNLTFQAHHVGWLVTGIFTLAATGVSFWLIYKHLKHYTVKREQRYIVRLLLMVPIYANVSFLGYILWNHSTPLLLVRDCYEAVVLTSFFYLLLQYISPTTAGQKEVFRTLPLPVPKKWAFPMGWVKSRPRDGLYFLQIAKWGILQYCFTRPFMTLVSVVLDFAGLYCEDSWSLRWGHPYDVLIISLSVSVGMYFLIQFYLTLKEQLAPHQPLLKLFAIKAVVFLTFWQASLLGGLATIGVVKDTKFMTADDINIGIGAILECFEMMCFAILHLKAFTYTPYRTVEPTYPPYTKWRALLHALDPRDTFREFRDGFKYFWAMKRGQDPEAREIRRKGDLEKVFERRRGESWYSASITEEQRKGKKKTEKIYGDVGESGRIRGRGGKGGWDDEEAWLVDDGADIRSLTSTNLRAHNTQFGKLKKPATAKNGQYQTLPVSSIHNTLETEEAGFVGGLDDPPPESLFVSYNGGRKEELRRMREAEGLSAGPTPPSKRSKKRDDSQGRHHPPSSASSPLKKQSMSPPDKTPNSPIPGQSSPIRRVPVPSPTLPLVVPQRKAPIPTPVPEPTRREATQFSVAATQGHVDDAHDPVTQASSSHSTAKPSPRFLLPKDEQRPTPRAGHSSQQQALLSPPLIPSKDKNTSVSTRGTNATTDDDEFYDFDETYLHGS